LRADCDPAHEVTRFTVSSLPLGRGIIFIHYFIYPLSVAARYRGARPCHGFQALIQFQRELAFQALSLEEWS